MPTNSPDPVEIERYKLETNRGDRDLVAPHLQGKAETQNPDRFGVSECSVSTQTGS